MKEIACSSQQSVSYSIEELLSDQSDRVKDKYNIMWCVECIFGPVQNGDSTALSLKPWQYGNDESQLEQANSSGIKSENWFFVQ